MKLQSKIKFKSLDPIRAINLPDFVILTGLNGSGKSQLLEGISNNQIELTDNEKILDPKKLVLPQSLSPNNSVVVTNETLKLESKKIFNEFNRYLQQRRNDIKYSLKSIIRNPKHIKVIEKIANNAEKDIKDLNADDFFDFYPLNDGLTNDDVFFQNFSKLFKRYQIKLYENQFRQFLRLEKGKSDVEFLSDEQFVLKYGDPPWFFVNNILKEANIDYHINSPENQNPDTPFELKLINNISQTEINFRDLSSGEKVLMSLAFALYNSKSDMIFPKVLLMDEPDASLHPSMAKQFLNVIQGVFVQEKKVKVILTTHSPSTVALAPNEALYVMNKTGQRIEKVNKDKALKILTSGVPSLSINYENRRQVFVESKYDVIFYEKVYDKLREKLIQEVSINFISSGINGEGDCEQVKGIVNKLVGFGNKTIYGIIDWDMHNNGNDFVKVLGKNKRYSIESYIFDPLLLGAFLLREKFISKEDIFLKENETYIDFRNFKCSRLQQISTFIIDKVRPQITEELDETMINVILINGKSYNIPKWFLFYQGHKLEKHLKTVFNQLKRFQGEASLKNEIIYKIIDDIPETLSTDLLDILKEIQDN